MHEFFNGWRRKAGCVTLMIALLFMGGWIRSTTDRDTAVIRTGTNSFFGFESEDGSMRLAHFSSDHPVTFFGNFEFESDLRSDALSLMAVVPSELRFAVPYWSIAVPLTLLSAYLILWKPRPKERRDA
jgi:hypothetical protein